jgi:hypothetical protein
METGRKKVSTIWEKMKTKARFPMDKRRHKELLFPPATTIGVSETESASSSDEDDDSQVEYLEEQFIAYMAITVAPFNTRNFTHQADLPLAFEGIAHALTQNAKAWDHVLGGAAFGVTPGAFSPCPHLVLERGRSPSARPRSWLPFLVMVGLGR